MNPAQLAKIEQRQIESLRAVLTAADYTQEGVLRTIGVGDSAAIKESDILLLMLRTKGGTPLETLIRLFLIELPVAVEELARAIAPMGIEEWERVGLIEVCDGSAAAVLKLFPFQDMVIVYDLPRRLLTADGHDYVMGVAGSSLTLANLTVRRHAGMVLDLGTGCGVQALLAARHSERVIAVDRNPRAVAMAALNARLNHIKTMECREGDLFAPVAGMTFDLIVSNPPFVISPESRYIYRDSGLAGDEICQRIVREAPAYLNEGGFCQILCNWAEYSGQEWQERLKGWFDGSGCDVWVMRNQSRDVATYAATWIRHTEKLDTENMAQRFDEWLAYYEREGIAQVGGGVITMRRRSASRNWFRADDGIETMYGPSSAPILQGFAAQDFLEGVLDDGLLLKTAFKLSPDARLVQQKQPGRGEWNMEVSELHLARGIAHRGNVDPYVEQLLILCDGTQPLEDLVEKMANSLEVERSRVEPVICNIVRSMVGMGYLLIPSAE